MRNGGRAYTYPACRLQRTTGPLPPSPPPLQIVGACFLARKIREHGEECGFRGSAFSWFNVLYFQLRSSVSPVRILLCCRLYCSRNHAPVIPIPTCQTFYISSRDTTTASPSIKVILLRLGELDQFDRIPLNAQSSRVAFSRIGFAAEPQCDEAKAEVCGRENFDENA